MNTTCVKCGAEFEIYSPKVSPELAAVIARLARNLVCDDCDQKQKRESEGIKRRESCQKIISRSRLSENMMDWNSELGNNALLDWVNANSGSSLYICNPYGTCKTRAVMVAAYQNYAFNPQMRFYRVSELIAEIMGYYSEGVREVNEFKESLYDLDLLILDDFGKEKITDRGGEALFDIIDNFYTSRRKIWITTNQANQETIIEHLGADLGFAIVRRISEMCKQWGQV